MNKNKHEFLLDTSIQIKRLLSLKWRKAGLDESWDNIIPVTCIYSFMEFKNTVIRAICYLIVALQEIAEQREKDAEDNVGVRLREVIIHLNIDAVTAQTDRRIRLASAYAAKILEENRYYPRRRSIAEVIEQLEIEANDLEKHWFFYYAVDKKIRKMNVIDKVNCALGHNKSPMHRNTSRYTCREGEEKCNIRNFITNSNMVKITQAISDKTIRVRSKRLKEGADAIHRKILDGTMNGPYGIGQKLCLPIGDCILTNKANMESLGILTADRDQVTLAKHLDMPSLFYDPTLGTIIK